MFESNCRVVKGARDIPPNPIYFQSEFTCPEEVQQPCLSEVPYSKSGRPEHTRQVNQTHEEEGLSQDIPCQLDHEILGKFFRQRHSSLAFAHRDIQLFCRKKNFLHCKWDFK